MTTAELDPAAYRRVLGALFAAGISTFALLYSTQAILPDIAERFEVSSGSAALTVSLSTLGIGLALAVAGPLSDRIGRTPLIHASMAASAVVELGCALAPTWEVLLVLRFLVGVTLAGLPAVATVYLREELPPVVQARAAGLYVGGTAIGGMLGRLVTGPVGEVAGWRWALASTGLIAVVCALVVRLLLPPSRGFVPSEPGVRSLLRATRRALGDPALIALYVVGAVSSGALIALYNGVGFRLVEPPFGLGLGAASLVFLAYPVGSVAAIVAGRLADRHGRRPVLVGAIAVAIAGCLLTLPAQLAFVAIGLAVLTAGFFAAHGIASGWVPVRAHAAQISAGQAASTYLVAFYAGTSLFGALGAEAWTGGGWSGVVTFSVTLFGVALMSALVLRRIPSLIRSG